MFAFIGNLLGGLGGLILDAVNGLLSGVVVFLTRIVDSLGGFLGILDGFKDCIGSIYTGFLSLVCAVFPFIPSEWVAILTTCFLATAVGVIVKKKVFD